MFQQNSFVPQVHKKLISYAILPVRDQYYLKLNYKSKSSLMKKYLI